MKDLKALTIEVTPAPGCEWCARKQVHPPDKLGPPLHPYARHGYVRETGWTNSALAAYDMAKKHPRILVPLS